MSLYALMISPSLFRL